MKVLLFNLLLFCFLALHSQNQVSLAEYWFDDEPGSSERLNITTGGQAGFAGEISTSHLNYGLHTVHLRFMDDSSRWSGVVSRFFIVSDNESTGTGNSFGTLEYWFDDRVSERITRQAVVSADYTIEDLLDVSGLGQGLHTFHFRMKDSRGNYSSATSRFFVFITSTGNSENNEVAGIEYWFDKNVESAQIIENPDGKSFLYLDELDVSSLKQGLHTISIRSFDSQGANTPPVTCFFIKPASETLSVNKNLTAIRYWLDDQPIQEKKLAESAAGIVFIDSLDLRMTAKGEYLLHYQFRDDQGIWSGAVCDTILKKSYPWGEFELDKISICPDDSIRFSSLFVDADSIAWDFGDGLASDDTIVYHSFPGDGNYTVKVNLYDREEDVSSEFTVFEDIRVNPLPSVNLGEDISICTGDEYVIDGPEGMAAYTWNTGNSEASINVATAGQYILTVTDQNACVNSDSLELSLLALPVVDIGDTLRLRDDESIMVEAGTSFESYSWNGITGQSEYMVSGPTLGAGNHLLELEVLDENGCSGSDTLVISISSTVSMDDVNETSFKVYPNPFTDILYVKNTGRVLPGTVIMIADPLGRQIMVKEIYGEDAEIRLEHLLPGPYFLIIRQDDKQKTISIIKH